MEQIRLIALDMDGTLLASDHRTVPQRNIEAIRRAQTAGIAVCINTGRMLEDASDFANRLHLPCMLAACNGARVSDAPLPGGRVLLRRQLAPADAHRALDVLMPLSLTVNGLEDGVVNTRSPDPTYRYHLVQRGLVASRVGEEALRDAADRGALMKLFIAAGTRGRAELAAAREQLLRALPHAEVTSSAPDNIEVMPQGTGKGHALCALAEVLGLTRAQVMAMGDAPNDLSMLRYAAHSVAMGNADPAVKAVCRYETLTNDDCGVAAMIERVLDAQRAEG